MFREERQALEALPSFLLNVIMVQLSESAHDELDACFVFTWLCGISHVVYIELMVEFH